MERNNIRRKRQRKTIWIKPLINLDVSTNVAKTLLNLIENPSPVQANYTKSLTKTLLQ